MAQVGKTPWTERMQSLAGGYSQVGGGNGGWTGTATPPLSVPNGHDEVQWRRGGSVGHCGGHGAPLRPTQAPPRPIVVKRPHRGYTLPSRAGNVDSCKRTGHTPKKQESPIYPQRLAPSSAERHTRKHATTLKRPHAQTDECLSTRCPTRAHTKTKKPRPLEKHRRTDCNSTDQNLNAGGRHPSR